MSFIKRIDRKEIFPKDLIGLYFKTNEGKYTEITHVKNPDGYSKIRLNGIYHDKESTKIYIKIIKKFSKKGEKSISYEEIT